MAEIADLDEIEKSEGGGSKLRQLLEQEIANRRKAEGELKTYKVKDVLSVKGFDMVKPEDLEGVDLDKVEERAGALQSERAALREEILRDVLQRQGIEGDALDDMVKELATRAPAEQAEVEEAEGFNRARSVGHIDSNPVPATNVDKLHGVDLLTAAFAADESKRR